MAIVHVVDEARRLIVTTVTGHLDDDDLLSADSSFRANPEYKPEYDQLIDLREAEGTRITRQAVQALAERPPFFASNVRRAIVAGSDIGFGMARMFELMRDSDAGEIRVFRELEAADRWLADGQPGKSTR